MENNREFRIIHELIQGVKVRNLYAHVYQDGKIYYRLQFPRERIYVYMEVDANELKKRATQILFRVSKVCYYENGSKNEENSQLLGKYLLFKQIDTFKSNEKAQTSSLDGTVTLQ